MATFSINGVPLSTVQGEATTVASSKTFTLSWSGINSATNYKVYFSISASHYENQSNSAGSNLYLYYYRSSEWASSSQTYKVIGTSGSDSITSSKSLSGVTITLHYCADGVYITSYYITFTAPPSITAPSSLKINGANAYAGTDATQTWTASKLRNTTGDITYHITFDSAEIATTTETSFDLVEDTAKNYPSVTISVYATGAGQTSKSSNTVTFEYIRANKTIMYKVNGSWSECSLFRYTNGEWIECAPVYYANGGWIECSH